MNERNRPFVERLELRITLRRVAEFFEALSKLDEPDKEILLEEIANNLREYMPGVPSILVPPTLPLQSFIDRCRDLATVAPNDRIRNILLRIADVYEIEAVVEVADANLPDVA